MTMSKPQIERGHEMPFVVQFSTCLPNRVGQLAELLGYLHEAGVEVAGLCQVDSTEWAVVRLVFSDPDKAREMLNRHQVAFTECDVLAIVIDQDEALQRICKALLGAELNVHVAYPLLIRRQDLPVLVLHVDERITAVQVLTKHGFTLLDHEDL